MGEPWERLQLARREAGYDGPASATARFGWPANTYKSNENGHAPFSFKKAKDYAKAYGVRVEWLYGGLGPMRGATVEVIGSVGADPEGIILLAKGDNPRDLVPTPPGGTDKAVALRVRGHSMGQIAEDGALIYFEDQRTPPTADMLGHVVVVETESDEVLIKRLLRGSRRGVFDLESITGPTRQDVRLRWAARISAIIPPWKAREIIIGRGEAA
jgi:hypothetical protein